MRVLVPKDEVQINTLFETTFQITLIRKRLAPMATVIIKSNGHLDAKLSNLTERKISGQQYCVTRFLIFTKIPHLPKVD